MKDKDKRGIPVRDADGQEFNSSAELCRYYNIPYRQFRRMIVRGVSMEKAIDRGIHRDSKVVDHLGNGFKTIKDMCEHWGVKPVSFTARIKRGKSLEEALTLGWHASKDIRDHLGNRYNSVEDMCKQYGISRTTFLHRIRYGKKDWTLEEALTTKSRKYCKKKEQYESESKEVDE